MAAAGRALALLLAASLLQPGASFDVADAKALFKAKAFFKRLAREPKAQRRLSGDENATFSEECRGECSGLDDMTADFEELEMSVQEEAPAEPWAGQLAMLDMFCDHKSTAQCFLDHPEECGSSEAQETFEMLTPTLACICGSCSRAKLALAKMMALGDSGDDEESQNGPEETRRMAEFTTTTEGMLDTTQAEFTTTKGGDDFDWDQWLDFLENYTNFTWPNMSWPDFDVDWGNMSFNLSDDTKETFCAFYALGSCVEEYPTECSALDDMWNISTYTTGVMGEMLEGMCTGELSPDAYGDDDDGNAGGDDDNDTDDLADLVGSCGPVGLGWFAASVPPVMAALQFMAA